MSTTRCFFNQDRTNVSTKRRCSRANFVGIYGRRAAVRSTHFTLGRCNRAQACRYNSGKMALVGLATAYSSWRTSLVTLMNFKHQTVTDSRRGYSTALGEDSATSGSFSGYQVRPTTNFNGHYTGGTSAGSGGHALNGLSPYQTTGCSNSGPGLFPRTSVSVGGGGSNLDSDFAVSIDYSKDFAVGFSGASLVLTSRR